MMKSQELKMNHINLKVPVLNTSEPKSSSNAACQTKSLQFRTIAPKAPSSLSPPALLSCQPSSSLPEASVASPKSIIVPAQNYALMRVAGQEGTFSLVALPPSISPQSPQQLQKGLTFPKNMKLPIPRYQPMKSKRTPDKTTATHLAKMQPPTKTVLQSQQAVHIKTSSSESAGTTEGSEQVILIDSGSSEIAVTTLLTENTILYSGAQAEKPTKSDRVDLDHASSSVLHFGPGVGRESNTSSSLPSNISSIPNTEDEGEKMKRCLSKPAGHSASSITVLSPAVFSKAVQIIPSPPKGKLPIPPYSKVKNAYLPMAKAPEKSCSAVQAANLATRVPNTSVTQIICQKQTPNSSPQNPLQGNASSLSNVELAASQRPAGKKRGRKRKTIEDVLAYEARKKRSLSFFRRRTPDKVAPVNNGPKDKVVDISKKYRSIRPKPVLLMEAVPQLVGLPSVQASDCPEQEFLIGQSLPSKIIDYQQLDLTCGNQESSKATDPSHVYLESKQLYRCPTCSRCFQFKHHLQSHMNSHTNSRPYVCPVCRKTYAHSGSLSTHMKLHHTEGRPRKTLRCEFCEKAFGYVGVYFSHLKEVHKVILTVEPSVSHHEEDVVIEGVSPSDSIDSQRQDQEEPVELQIKCGRCQAITPTFADMKLHLLYVHGEEVQVRLKEGVVQGGREAEDELVKHAAHYWRQLNEKRNLVKCGSCKEEFFSFSRLKRHTCSHHQDKSEAKAEWCVHDKPDANSTESPHSTSPVTPNRNVADSALHCILCPSILGSREGLFDHWRSQHNCENPAALWRVVSSFTERKEIGLSSENPEQ
ncbi:zinc finger protein 438 isoform X1 [Lepisosteus oculatus]|uniref:zinc finger protein 438 isoform X1 n=1 Tax=Lepisosteus oculatus TaxID=7918 RepID=UPI0037177886